MSDTVFVKPAKHVRVRDPVTATPLDEHGEDKPRNSYWLRRLADGDVREASPPPQPSASRGEGEGGGKSKGSNK